MSHNDEAGGSRTGGEDPYLSMLGQYTGVDEEMVDADDDMEEPRQNEAPSGREAVRGDSETTTSGLGRAARLVAKPRKIGNVRRGTQTSSAAPNMNSQRWTLKAVFLQSR